MSDCSETQEELAHNGWQDSRVYETASEQMAAVEEAAARLLRGEAIKGFSGSRPVSWDLGAVADLFAEEVTNQVMIEIMAGDLTSAQDLIARCAQQTAFYALGLESGPFIDLEDLISTSEAGPC